MYSVLRLKLPCEPRNEDQYGMAFDFLADQPAMFDERSKVKTGHANGVITVNIAEADPVERERMRSQMAELLSHRFGAFSPRIRPLLLGSAGPVRAMARAGPGDVWR